MYYIIKKSGSITPERSYCAATYIPFHKAYKKNKVNMLGAYREIDSSFICGLLHIDTSALADLERLPFINSMRSPDIVYKTSWDGWTIYIYMERDRDRDRERQR